MGRKAKRSYKGEQMKKATLIVIAAIIAGILADIMGLNAPIAMLSCMVASVVMLIKDDL